MPQRPLLCGQMHCESLQQPLRCARNASRALPAGLSSWSSLYHIPLPGHPTASASQGRGQQGIGGGMMEQAECSRMRPVERERVVARKLGLGPLHLHVSLPAGRVLGMRSTHD